MLDWLGHGYSCVSCELLEDWGAGCALFPFYFLPPSSVIPSSPGTRAAHRPRVSEQKNSTAPWRSWGRQGVWGRRDGGGGGGQGATSGREERARRRWKGSNTFMSGLTDRLSLLSCTDAEQQRGKQQQCSARFHANLKVVIFNPAGLDVPANNGSFLTCSLTCFIMLSANVVVTWHTKEA